MTSSAPRISVVIPVYNGTNYLREAIDSVLAQTYTNYECIVVDDGSTDGTWELIQSYGDKVRGIRQPNGGTANAFNNGVRAARGEFISWLSHDDNYLPHKLQRQIEVMDAHPEAGGCYSDFYLIDNTSTVQREMKLPYYPPGEMVRHLLQWMFINGCAVLVRKQCFDQEGYFDEKLRYVHDADMWFRILRRFEFVHLPETLIRYRVHPTQESQKLRKMRADNHEWWRRCLNDYPLTDIFPELIGREHERAAVARAHLCLGDIMRVCHADMVLARTAYRRAWQAWPSGRNPVIFRALALQFWMPGVNWVARRSLQVLLKALPRAWGYPRSLKQRDDISSASNAVPCPRL